MRRNLAKSARSEKADWQMPRNQEDGDGVSSTAQDRSPSRMQTMPAKSLATSLMRKRRELNDMYYRFRLTLPPFQNQGYSSFGQKPTVSSDRQFSGARSA
jgi:hypothetical protein